MGALVFFLWLSPANLTPTPAVQNPWPCTIAIGRNGPSLLPTMWELSPTFQHQCRRLAIEHVVIVVQWTNDMSSLHHAETRIVLNGGRVFRAVVRLRPSDEPAVQLVHELEHVMEALEGIDQRSGRWGMQTAGGAYETARAERVETRARRELAPLILPPPYWRQARTVAETR